MRNEECCRYWAKDCANFYVNNELQKINHIKYKATNVSAKGNKLYSYYTPICEFVDGKFIYSEKKYSMSTSKHQHYMRSAIIHESGLNDLTVRCVYDINERYNNGNEL